MFSQLASLISNPDEMPRAFAGTFADMVGSGSWEWKKMPGRDGELELG